ncbi:hypothetical protein Cgig2_010560 [Carnegiea gigantea]|uniref:Enoyl reductase (ER) domain-containing protein n=1 Tax=Carnegiea gigantea TaxID=171969 RepID=A0A9Q1KSB2_9CARY|nr:hypothetical protein Cgig2_010560 [Carnegiea gigantea]
MGKGGSHGEGEKEQNMAAWLMGINTLKIQPFELPPLGPHDVRVRMKAVGICGSDVHYLKTLRCADFVVKEPMVIGHECAGIIEEVGSQVKSLLPGDRVALEPGISCWRCNLCKDGRYNLCPEMKFFATPPVHGSLANQVTDSSLMFPKYLIMSPGQVVHPADLCFKLPENVSLEEGAMCEPLSVGLHACRRASTGPETTALIMGAGPIGLVTMLAARAFGAPRIVIVDVHDYRLSVAKQLGADNIVKVSTNMQIGKGAKVPLLNILCHRKCSIHGNFQLEVDIVGVFRYKNTWPLCLEFLSSGKIDVKPLITHRFGFSQEEVEEAFETSARGGNAIKVMFNLGGGKSLQEPKAREATIQQASKALKLKPLRCCAL